MVVAAMAALSACASSAGHAEPNGSPVIAISSAPVVPSGSSPQDAAPGPCGGSCGGACVEGRCLITLASGQRRPYSVAVDATHVYWTNQGDGTVMKCALTGCDDHPTTLATGQNNPYGVAVDATHVYWVTYGGGTVMKCATRGCDDRPTTLASKQSIPRSIAVDGTHVYWTNGGSVAVGAVGAFWTNDHGGPDGTVMKCALAGCGTSPSPLASGLRGPGGCAIDDTSIYWTNWSGHSVMKCALSGCNGAPVMLSSKLRLPLGGDVAVDTSSIYFASGDKIMRLTPK